MQETPEHTAPEPAAVPELARPKPAAWLRVLMLAALFATGILVGVVAMYARVQESPSSAKPPRIVKSSVKATQPAPVEKIEAAPAKPSVEPITIAGTVADEFGRTLADVMILVGREAQAASGATKPGIGELGVTDGPVPAIPDGTAVTPPRDAATARTDQDGKFSISWLEPGNAQLFVTQPGYEPVFLSLEGLRAGEARDQLYVVLRTPAEVLPVEPVVATDPTLGRVAGIVIDVLGRPVAQAIVETDEGEASTQTDASGAFELVGVAPGALRLFATDETAGRGESAEIRARSGELLPGVRIHLPGRHVPSTELVAVVKPRPLPQATNTVSGQKTSPVLQGGIALEQRTNSVIVSLIDQNSVAAKAGLLAGDALLKVDNEPVLSASQARGMLRDPTGVPVRVQISRAGKRVVLRWKRPGIRYFSSP